MKGTAGHPLRLRFTKRGKVRFISHRDVARAFDRAFRITQLPLAFTEGFSPRPKVSFGLALVGRPRERRRVPRRRAPATSLDPEALVAPLTASLPEGIEVTGAVGARRPGPCAAGGRHLGRLPRHPVRPPRRATPGVGPREPRRGRDASTPSCPSPRSARARQRVVDVKPVITHHRARARRFGARARAVPVHPTTRCPSARGARRPRRGRGRRPRRGPRGANRPMDRARRRADGTAGSRRAHAHPRGVRVMREGTHVRRHDARGAHRRRPHPPAPGTPAPPRLTRPPTRSAPTRRRRPAPPLAPPPTPRPARADRPAGAVAAPAVGGTARSPQGRPHRARARRRAPRRAVPSTTTTTTSRASRRTSTTRAPTAG